jgi:putative aldouronate transport system substrate-binding protein
MDDLFYEWMFRNNKYLRMPTNVSDDFVKDFQDWDKGAKYSKLFGFTFDATPVKAEAANINALQSQYNLLLWGLVDASKGDTYDKVVNSLKKAGLDAYVAEYNKQFAAYSAEQK